MCRNSHKVFIYFIAFLSVLVCISSLCPLYGQKQDGQSAGTGRNAGGLDLISFKTNALEWLLTIPNFSVEFDLASQDSSHRSTSRMSVSLTGKYNWNTAHTYAIVEGDDKVSYGHASPLLLNLWEARTEYRYHWRYFKDPNVWMDGKGNRVKPGFRNWMKHEMMSVSREEPNELIAWYLGLYASYGEYAFKFTRTGHQTQAAGLGLSFGIVKPLYQYKKFDIDFELGFSLGALLCLNYERFGHNSDKYYYYLISHKDLVVPPFPVISELRASFAFRTKSVKDKYLKETDWEKRYRKRRGDAIFELQTKSMEGGE